MINRTRFWLAILLLGVPAGCGGSAGPGIAPPPPTGQAKANAPTAETAPPQTVGPKLQPAKLPGLSLTPPTK